jgi:hypothetical protein
MKDKGIVQGRVVMQKHWATFDLVEMILPVTNEVQLFLSCVLIYVNSSKQPGQRSRL